MSNQQEVPPSYELDGVIEDYERNGTFDAVSLATVKRVREAIVRGERRIDGTPYHEYIMQEIQRLPPEKPRIERELEWLREQHARDSAELAALRKRIEEAPSVRVVGIIPIVGWMEYENPEGGFFEKSLDEPCPLLGKRVHLVVEE